jgi:hypothetical protein
VDDDAHPGDAEHVEWRHGEDVLARTTWAEVDHGSSYGGFHGSRCTEWYVGRVEHDAATGVQRASGTTTFRVAWPDGVTATSVATLDLEVGDEANDVTVDLDVHDGDALLGSRHWQERLPRFPV